MDFRHSLFLPKRWFIAGLVLALIFSTLAVDLPICSTTTQSYIVQGKSVDQVVELVERNGGQVTSRLHIIESVGALLTPQAVAALRAEADIVAVTPNASVQASGGDVYPLTDYPDLTGADEVWADGIDGSGVTVAVVDTGLGKNPGIKHQIVGWVDFVDGSNKYHDPNGHGTHVAGIIANTQNGEDGEPNGMAPGATLVGVRVLDEDGYGTYETVIQGIQWVVDHHQEYNIRVMNLSLIALVHSPYWADPLNRAVMRAWAEDIVVVVAAGNDGPEPMTIGVPGNIPYVVTVGAFTDNYTVYDWNDDYITPFSSVGPTLDGFVKPDLVAPGGHIVSTMNHGAELARQYPDQRIPPQYFRLAGTSQSAAITSGTVALVLSREPNLTNDQVKYRLMNTAILWVDPDSTEALYSMFQQGAGRLNAYDAVFSNTSEAANVGLDLQADLWQEQHYEGFAYYDETIGRFRLYGDFQDWDGGYWAWDGGYGAWSGGYGAWSGGYGAWSGDYGAWSGGYGAWSGDEPWAGSYIAEVSFVEGFLAGVSPDEGTSTTTIGYIEEP